MVEKEIGWEGEKGEGGKEGKREVGKEEGRDGGREDERGREARSGGKEGGMKVGRREGSRDGLNKGNSTEGYRLEGGRFGEGKGKEGGREGGMKGRRRDGGREAGVYQFHVWVYYIHTGSMVRVLPCNVRMTAVKRSHTHELLTSANLLRCCAKKQECTLPQEVCVSKSTCRRIYYTGEFESSASSLLTHQCLDVFKYICF